MSVVTVHRQRWGNTKVRCRVLLIIMKLIIKFEYIFLYNYFGGRKKEKDLSLMWNKLDNIRLSSYNIIYISVYLLHICICIYYTYIYIYHIVRSLLLTCPQSRKKSQANKLWNHQSMWKVFQIGKPYENLSTGQAVKKLLQALLHCAVS